MLTSRSVPQHWEQMSPPPRDNTGVLSGSRRFGTPRCHRIIRSMARTDIFLKVVVEHEEEENASRLAEEICRRLEKLYGVRYAEVSSMVRQGASEN